MFKINVQESYTPTRKAGKTENETEGMEIVVTCNVDAPKPKERDFEIEWKIREHFFIDKTTGAVMSHQEVFDNLNANIKSFNEFAKANIPGATGGRVAKVEEKSFVERPVKNKNSGYRTLEYGTEIEYLGYNKVIYDAKIHDRD